MNLDDSLTAACEQLWRAAVSVAALKYIAGLVNREWNGLTIKTEAEGAIKNIKLHKNESQDKTEVSNHENIIDRLAAEIVLNNIEDDGSENEETDDSLFEDNEESKESILDQNDLKETDDPRDDAWSPSFASHCVISPDLASDEQIFHQDIVSLTTHCINNDNVELGVSESFTVHQCQDQYLLPAHDDVQDDQNVQIDQDEQIDVLSDQESIISCDDDEEINNDIINNQVIITNVNMSNTDQEEIFTEANDEETIDYQDEQEEVIEVEETNFLTDFCQQKLVVNVVKGVEFTTSIQFNQLNLKDEEVDNFLSSMVSHQLPSVSPQEEYPTYIQSSTAHSCLRTEEEYCESLTTISSHLKESFYDSGVFEDVNEESIELTEDAADEYTDYTEVEHLETIQEVSEICDVTTDITESEMTEEIEDFPYSMDTQTADIIQLVPLDEESDVSMIEQGEEDIVSYHDEAVDQQNDEDLNHELIELKEFERNENLSLFLTEIHTTETEENSIEEFLETDTITEDYLETETSEVYEETYFGQQQKIDCTTEELTDVEIQDDVGSYESMVSHTVVEAESDLMPSSASHLVNTISEENNFTSMVAHFFQYYLINSAQEQELEEISGRLQNIFPHVQEESIGMFNIEEFHVFYPKVEEEKANFYYDSPLTSMSSHQVCNEGLLEDFQEVQFITSMQSHMSTNEVNSQDQDSKLPLMEINSCLKEEKLEENHLRIEEEIEPQQKEDRLTEEFCQLKEEETEKSEINEPAAEENNYLSEKDKNESEPVIQTYKLQLTRLQQLQKLVEDELEEFDTQRKCKVDLEQATETQVVNIVKGVEFITNIKINQVYDEDNDKIPTHETNFETQDLVREKVATENDFTEDKEDEDNTEFFSEEDEESTDDELENLIHASCTLNYDRVSITSNLINESQPHDIESKPHEIESTAKEEEEAACTDKIVENEADLNLNKPLPPPRKSINIQDKIRDRQSLNSLDHDRLTMQTIDANEDDTIEDNEDLNDNNAESNDQKVQLTQNSEQDTEGKAKASILKNKSSVVKVATATLNENVKKQSYRIKFKIKLNDNNQKKQTSVLRYLFGCFGGEKLFNSSQKQ